MFQVRAEIRVRGRVQGVGYRASAAWRARELGLVGSARNANDGSVEIVVEGDEVGVTAFVTWCGRGPSLAIVEQVEVERGEPRGNLHGFVVG